MSPKCSAKVLSIVPKCKQALLCLKEKMHVLDKLLSGMSHGAAGLEFNISQATNT